MGTSSLAGGVARDGEHNSIFVAGWTHAFSPTLLLDSYVSYLHLPLYRDAQSHQTDFSTIIPSLGKQLLSGAPTISITNITGITEAGSKNLEQTYQGNTALTKVLPRHTVKAGISYLYNTSWQDSSTSHGSFAFTGRYTGVAYADFLLGLPNTTSNATTEQSRRPLQPFSTITDAFDPAYHTTGNSLQIGVHKQYRNGLMVNAE